MTLNPTLGPALVASALIAACGGAAAPADVADGSTPLQGSFVIQLVAATATAPAYANVIGRVQQGETPEATLWDVALAEGDCRVVTPRTPFCASPCGVSGVCTAGGACRPYPAARAAGTVRLTGLRTTTGPAPIELTLVANNYQPPASVTLAFPPFAEGDALRLESTGIATVPPFALEARGLAPLAVTSAMLEVAMSSPLTLRWTPPGAAGDGAARVRVKLDISHHGGTRGMITCDTTDDGELTIAASLVTRLVGLGVAGFPSIVVTRESVASAALAGGRVRFVISSSTEQSVTVPGVRSCTDDADCMGMGTCRPDLTCGR